MKEKVIQWRKQPDMNTGIQLAKELRIIPKRYNNIDFLFYDLCKAVGLEKQFYAQNTFIVKGIVNINKQYVELIEKKHEDRANTSTRNNNDRGLTNGNDYNYSLKFKEYPKELQQLIVNKGKLYNRRKILITKLNATGTGNDDAKINASRKEYIKEIKSLTNEIKATYNFLREYEETRKLPKQVIAETNKEESDELDKLFNYKAMDYYQQKDLLNRLRRQIKSQNRRLKTYTKPNIIEKNKTKLEQVNRMIDKLETILKYAYKEERTNNKTIGSTTN